MSKRFMKWFLAILLVLVAAVAIFLVNLIRFRPWSNNSGGRAITAS